MKTPASCSDRSCEDMLVERRCAAASGILGEAIDAIPDGFAVFDQDDRLILCNRAYRTLFPDLVDLLRPGTPYRTLVERSSQAVAGADAGEWLALRDGPGRGALDGLTVRRPDGRWLHLDERRTRRGYTVGVRKDLTALKDVEERLRGSEAKYRTLFECAPVGLVLSDAAGGILETNPAFERLIGIGPAPVGTALAACLPEAVRGTVATRIAGIAAAGRFEPFEFDPARPEEEASTLVLQGDLHESPAGETLILWILQDVTARKRNERAIWEAARRDTVTGLPNRAYLAEHLAIATEASAAGASGLGVILVDLDDFKLVNDTLGHEAGDVLLHDLARRLDAGGGGRNFVARLGGDEFAVVVHDMGSLAELDRTARRLVQRVRETVDYRGHAMRVTASVGVAALPDHGDGVDTLLRAADLALYAAKREGGNRAVVYEAGLLERAERRFAVIAAGRAAYDGNHVVPAYQPIFDLSTGVLSGLEALFRVRAPDGTLASLADMAWIFEDAEVGRAIDLRMLDLVLDQIAAWSRLSLAPDHVSINLCEQALWTDDPGAEVLRALHRRAIPPERLRIEITETHLLGDVDRIAACMRALSRQGLRFALDDFGTGHASLTHLKTLPVSEVKIDRSFVTDIETDPASRTIVKGLIDVCRGLGRSVVAEGIETTAQSALLRSFGCPNGQGWLFGRPVAAEAIEAELLHSVHRQMAARAAAAEEGELRPGRRRAVLRLP